MMMDDQEDFVISSIPIGQTYRIRVVTLDEFSADVYGCPYVLEVSPIDYDVETPNIYHVE
jgi:hypothetical protein